MYRRYFWMLLAMALLTPLGLLTEGTAWGEWGAEDLQEKLGFVPKGIEQGATWWRSLFPDYTVSWFGEGRGAEYAGYLFSAVTGALLVYGSMLVCVRMLTKARPRS